MRPYGQFCALARALDIVGDRWTLLIVRELAIRPCRYGDLLDGLPGIATNLLAERLRALESHGLVTPEDAPPPISATLYELTPRGHALWPSLVALAAWGSHEMTRGQGDDAFRPHWLAVVIAVLTDGIESGDLASLRVRLVTADDESIDVVVGPQGITSELHSGLEPDIVITGEPDVILATLAGSRTGAVAKDRKVARRFAELTRRVAAASTATPTHPHPADPAGPGPRAGAGRRAR